MLNFMKRLIARMKMEIRGESSVKIEISADEVNAILRRRGYGETTWMIFEPHMIERILISEKRLPLGFELVSYNRTTRIITFERINKEKQA